jgi:hypothetical protein
MKENRVITANTLKPLLTEKRRTDIYGRAVFENTFNVENLFDMEINAGGDVA